MSGVDGGQQDSTVELSGAAPGGAFGGQQLAAGSCFGSVVVIKISGYMERPPHAFKTA
jgi:hypothetical protein